ncbi:MAG: signal peptidase II [Blautia sp.]|nr:signal peptidase II [Blautia sp.]
MNADRNKYAGRFLTALFFAASLVSIDQITKILAGIHLKQKLPVTLIPDILELYYLYPENKGIAFGLLQGKTFFFAVVCFILLFLFCLVYLKVPSTNYYRYFRVSLLVLAAGACGNLIDRCFRGYVIDFIYISCIDFPVFNIADIFVVCSGIVLTLLLLFYYKEEDFDFLINRESRKRK